MDQERLNNAILEVFGHPDFELIKQGLEAEIYASQARALDAATWEEVNELRGYAKGLAFVMNLRETTEQIMEQEEQNAL